MSKLVDPVHLFDINGLSVLSRGHLEAENARLEKENAMLKAKLRQVIARLRRAEDIKTA